MKRIFMMLSILIVFSSCSSSLYFQVYNIEADNVVKKENNFIYSNEDCDIKYNLWSEKGNLSFVFTNKTDIDICLDMERSCFIRDGFAYSYFYSEKEHLKIESKSHLSSSIFVTETNTTFISEEYPSKIWIPANSSRIIRGFNILSEPYLECDKFDLNFPKKYSETIKYTASTTPLTIKNRLVYYFANDEKDRIIENKFWIIDYTNYSEKEMFEWKNNYDCLRGTIQNIQVLKHQKTYRFYNTYNKILPVY